MMAWAYMIGKRVFTQEQIKGDLSKSREICPVNVKEGKKAAFVDNHRLTTYLFWYIFSK